MDGKLAISSKIALPVALVVVGGYALGYAHGYQDALGTIWNLRGVAECLDPSARTNENLSEQEEGTSSRGQWVWKVGHHKGEPVNNWSHIVFSNPFRGIPLLESLGNRLESYCTIDAANWRPPSY